MAIASESEVQELFADKAELQKVLAAENAVMGFSKDPTATPQRAREMMARLGIRAEDNEFSRDIIAAREGG